MDRRRHEVPRDGAPSPSFLTDLADRLGARTSASLVYGEPVERAGVTVIPVARVAWGFGGGEQALGADGPGGSGGGGGLVASPAGYIEIRDGRARYRPAVDPVYVTIVAVAGAVVSAILGAFLLRRRDRA